MTLGFVVGKFYPPHKGHKHLIDTARKQVDQLVVMIAHHPTQTIPGELRQAWLQEIHPTCDVHLVPDELENDSSQWAAFTIKHLGRAPDVVFTSEDYGDEFARFMNCRHISVDRQRAVVPVSGSKIRAAPLDHLDFLEPCVRAHYVKRVVLIGAESTGKTTLAQQLADTFETCWVPEYGREHWERKVAGLQMTDPLPAWSADEFVHIAREQQRHENDAATRANRVLICDTNAFATGTWYERYQGSRSQEVDAIGAKDKVDLYLLTKPDVPFVQDGVRDGELIRDWMHTRFAGLLPSTHAPVVLIEGAYERRFATARAAVVELLNPSRL